MGRHLPLVVTATLHAPVVTDYPIHLDALLTEAVGKRLGLLASDTLRHDHPDRFQRIQLPLASIMRHGREVWCASAEVTDQRIQTDHWWVRRRDAVDEESMARSFTPGAGPDRNMMLRRSGYAAHHVRWYAIGHKREVRKALALISAIGAKRAQGCGAVGSWTVEHLPSGADPLCWLVGPQGDVRRHVPADWLPDCRTTHGAWHSPYFLAAFQSQVTAIGATATIPDWLCHSAELAVSPPC